MSDNTELIVELRLVIDEQAATIEAVKQWRTQWDRDTRRAMAREALTSILYPTEGTR